MADPSKKAVFISKRMIFDKMNNSLVDMIQAHMSGDIETMIKLNAGTPVKTGGMKAEVRHFKTDRGKWRVEANKEYSAYQERGARADGSRPVQQYTTPGTSAGWFKRSIDTIWKNRDSYISEARKAMGL